MRRLPELAPLASPFSYRRPRLSALLDLDSFCELDRSAEPFAAALKADLQSSLDWLGLCGPLSASDVSFCQGKGLVCTPGKQKKEEKKHPRGITNIFNHISE